MTNSEEIDDIGKGQDFDSDRECDPIGTESDDTFTNEEYISSSNSDTNQNFSDNVYSNIAAVEVVMS